MMPLSPKRDIIIEPSKDYTVTDGHMDNIHRLLLDSSIVKVVGPSGTGKSTLLPYRLSKDKQVLVAVANKSVADNMTSYMSSKNLTYMSSQEVKEMMYNNIRQKSPMAVDILMVDEIDSASKDNFLIMSMWRYMAENNFRVPKLVLTSTLEYPDLFPEEPTYIIDTTRYPVEIRYRTDVSIVELVYEIYPNVEGDILILVPDKNSVLSLTQEIDMDVYPIHSDTSASELEKIYRKDKKIVISSITSITLDNIEIIIDTLREVKHELTLTGGSRVKEGYVSKDMADIRAKKAGRYRSAVVYRLVDSLVYDSLPDSSKEEIYRIPLYKIILELMEEQIPLQVLDMIPSEELEYNLYLINFLKVTEPEVRRFVHDSPLGIRQAVSLWYWIREGYPCYPALAILSMIDNFSSESLYLYPLRDETLSTAEYNLVKLSHYQTYFLPLAGPDDLTTYTNIWVSLLNDLEGDLGTDSDSDSVKRWCQDNSINYTIISEVLKTIKMVKDCPVVPFTTNGLIERLAPILKAVYSDRLMLRDGVRYRSRHGDLYSLDSFYSVKMEYDTSKVYAVITSTTTSERGDFRSILFDLV